MEDGSKQKPVESRSAIFLQETTPGNKKLSPIEQSSKLDGLVSTKSNHHDQFTSKSNVEHHAQRRHNEPEKILKKTHDKQPV